MTFISEMLSGFGDIFSAPFKSLEVLWLLIPLILLWISLEIYFARYKSEKLGWNTALANGITLGWITLESLRYLFNINPDDFWFRLGINLVILIYAFIIMYISFTHKINSKWNFILASPAPIYFLSIFSVLWGHGILVISRYVIIDLIILFLLINLCIMILRKFIKPADKDEGRIPDLDSDMSGTDDKMPDLGKDLEGFPPLEKL